MDALDQLRTICLRLPESSERLSHGSPAFFVRGKTVFTMFADGAYNEPGPTIWCPAPAGVQDELTSAEPAQFFVPPYVGHRGWIGVRLDVDTDWAEIDAIVQDGFRRVAPKRLAVLLD